MNSQESIRKDVMYFIIADNQQQGPFDFSTITSYISQGQVLPRTLIWKEGMKSWAETISLAEFSDAFGTDGDAEAAEDDPILFCSNCGARISQEMAFCPNCCKCVIDK